MRLIMMGTGPFAVPTFESLLDSVHEVAALITRPTPPARGRQKVPPNPMRDVAEQRQLPVFAPNSINDPQAQQILTELNADLMVVCDYGQILSNETLKLAPLGGINLHASLLPKYRGAAPINWALWDGCSETGVTVIHMTPKLDGGPCLVQVKTPIDPQETAEDLEPRLAQIGVDSVNRAIEMLDLWDRESDLGERQNAGQATKAPRLRKSDGQVDWSRSAVQIVNQVRAFKPWPGTFTALRRLNGSEIRLILECVSLCDVSTRLREADISDKTFGKILSVDKDGVQVATGEGVLSIHRVKPAGKRAMDIAEFLRGHPMTPEEEFA